MCCVLGQKKKSKRREKDQYIRHDKRRGNRNRNMSSANWGWCMSYKINNQYTQFLTNYPKIDTIDENCMRTIYLYSLDEKKIILINGRKDKFSHTKKYYGTREYQITNNKWGIVPSSCHYNFSFDCIAFNQTEQIIYFMELCTQDLSLNQSIQYVYLISLNLRDQKAFTRDRIDFPYHVNKLPSQAFCIDNKLIITANYIDFKKSFSKYQLGIFSYDLIRIEINRYHNTYYRYHQNWNLIASVSIEHDFKLLYNKNNHCLLFIGGCRYNKLQSLISFDLTTQIWTTLERSLPPGIQHSFCILARKNQYIIMLGGSYWDKYSLSQSYSTKIYCYHLKTKKLSQSLLCCPFPSAYIGIVIDTPARDYLTVCAYIRYHWTKNNMMNFLFPPNDVLHIIRGYYESEYVYLFHEDSETQHRMNIFDIITLEEQEEEDEEQDDDINQVVIYIGTDNAQNQLHLHNELITTCINRGRRK